MITVAVTVIGNLHQPAGALRARRHRIKPAFLFDQGQDKLRKVTLVLAEIVTVVKYGIPPKGLINRPGNNLYHFNVLGLRRRLCLLFLQGLLLTLQADGQFCQEFGGDLGWCIFGGKDKTKVLGDELVLGGRNLGPSNRRDHDTINKLIRNTVFYQYMPLSINESCQLSFLNHHQLP